MKQPTNRKWLDEELQQFISLYPTTPNKELAVRFNMTINAIKSMAWRYSVSKKTGKEPTSGTPGEVRRAYDTAKEGDISIRSSNRRQYKYIKVGNKWVPLQRYNWIQAGLPLAPEQRLQCKSGDILNCDPSNWQVAASAKERKEKRKKERQKKSTGRPVGRPRSNPENQWHQQRERTKARERNKVLPFRTPDLTNLIPVIIPDEKKTIIYIKPGQDKQTAIDAYLARKQKTV